MKIPKSLEQSIREAETLLDRRKQIREAITGAEEQIAQARHALRGAEQSHQQEQAAAALEGGPVAGSAIRAVATARAGLEAAEARLAGLRQRLATSDEELTQMAERFGAERRAFRSAVIEGFRESYRAAAQQFARVLRHGHGLAAGLGAQFDGLAAVKLFDLDSTREIIPLFERVRDASGTWRSNWESDADARRAFDEVASVRAVADRLTRESKPLREAAKAEAEAEARAAARDAYEHAPKSGGLTYPPTQPEAAVQKVKITPARMFPDAPERRAGHPVAAHMNPDD
jgi:hypothetical protein